MHITSISTLGSIKTKPAIKMVLNDFFKVVNILNILGSKTCQDNLSSFAKGIPEGHT